MFSSLGFRQGTRGSAMSRVPGLCPRPTPAFQSLLFVKHTQAEHEAYRVDGQRHKPPRCCLPGLCPTYHKGQRRRERASCMKCKLWDTPLLRSQFQAAAQLFNILNVYFERTGAGSPCLIRTWKAIRNCVMTTSQGSQGAVWEKAYRPPISDAKVSLTRNTYKTRFYTDQLTKSCDQQLAGT